MPGKNHAKKMTKSDKEFVEKTMNQIVDNMGKDYDKSLTKQMRKSKNNRQYIGNEEVGKFDEAKVNDRIETDAMNSVAKKYGIKMKSGGKVLKPVPAGKKGLSKLPTQVRNKMGFMKSGGRVNTKRMNKLEELGRVDAEKAKTSKGKRNLKQEKKRIVRELKKK